MDGSWKALDGLLYCMSSFSLITFASDLELIHFHFQRGKKEYNLVLIHPDDGSVESWTAEGSADKLRADFADYDPRCVSNWFLHLSSGTKLPGLAFGDFSLTCSRH